MKTLAVCLSGASYDILIGNGLLEDVGQQILPLVKKEIAVVVSDENVWSLYGNRVLVSLKKAGIQATPIILPPGEETKCLSRLEDVCIRFAGAGLKRSGLVIALGGGVIGDLAGFAAATYMRGVRFVQIPTTLLAQVDSSVGGKTAVNLPGGKNLIGAFYQPALVLSDTKVLDTLSVREMRSGMAEVIKYGVIRSRSLFDVISSGNHDRAGIVEACCVIKADIVSRDERDTGERMVLNFGHTFGHGIETLGGFQRHNHGEAVAIGMIIAASVGEAMGMTEHGTVMELKRVLENLGLETTCPYSARELMPLLRSDKKGADSGIKLILPGQIGESIIHDAAYGELDELLKRTEPIWHWKS